jgi:hypothetical protein
MRAMLGSVVFSAVRKCPTNVLSSRDPERAPFELPAHPPAKRTSENSTSTHSGE